MASGRCETCYHVKQLAAGGLAGVFAKTCTAPLGRLTIMYQVGTLRADVRGGIWASLRHIVRTEGMLGLWRGHLATVLHRLPYSAVNFAVFESSAKALNPYLRSRADGGTFSTEMTRYLIAGGLGGSVGCAVAYPFDLLKTRLMAPIVDQGASTQYKGLLDAAHRIVSAEGVLGLYRGLGATLLQVTPTLAINFAAYEFTKSHLQGVFEIHPRPNSHKAVLPAVAASRSTSTAARRPHADTLTPGTDEAQQPIGTGGDSGGEVSGAVHTQQQQQHKNADWQPVDGGTGVPGGSCFAGEGNGEAAGAAESIQAPAKETKVAVLEGRAAGVAGERGHRQPVFLSVEESLFCNPMCQKAMISFVAGSVSGLTSSTLTFPLDIVRRNIVMPKFKGMSYLEVVAHLLKEQDKRKWVLALGTEYLKVVPTVALSFCAYEFLRTTLGLDGL